MLKIEIVQDYLSDAVVVFNHEVSITKRPVNCSAIFIGDDTEDMNKLPFWPLSEKEIQNFKQFGAMYFVLMQTTIQEIPYDGKLARNEGSL